MRKPRKSPVADADPQLPASSVDGANGREPGLPHRAQLARLLTALRSEKWESAYDGFDGSASVCETESALAAIARLGPAAADIAVDLAALLDDDRKLYEQLEPFGRATQSVGEAVGEVLAKLGDPAIAHLLPRLLDDRRSTRDNAAKLLYSMGPAAVPQLTLEFDRAGHRLRLRMLELFAEAGWSELSARLESRLDDPDATVRKLAVHGLRYEVCRREHEGSPTALTLCKRLRSLLTDADAGVRAKAASVFGETAASIDPGILGDLIPVAGDPDANVRRAVAAVLGPVLAGALTATDPPGPTTIEAAVAALTDATRDADRDVRRAAADALRRIPVAMADRMVPIMVDALRDRDLTVAADAARGLVCLANCAARSLVPHLDRIAAGLHREWPASHVVAQVLTLLGPAAAPAAGEMMNAWTADRKASGHLGSWLTAAIAAIGPGAGGAVLAAFDSTDDHRRQAAALALGTLGIGDAAIIERLAAEADTDDRIHCACMTEGLSGIGSGAARKALKKLSSRSTRQHVRDSASSALEQARPRSGKR